MTSGINAHTSTTDMISGILSMDTSTADSKYFIFLKDYILLMMLICGSLSMLISIQISGINYEFLQLLLISGSLSIHTSTAHIANNYILYQ